MKQKIPIYSLIPIDEFKTHLNVDDRDDPLLLLEHYPVRKLLAVYALSGVYGFS